MIEDAIKMAFFLGGDMIIEASGGNTGLGLVIAANLYGIKTVLCIQDNFRREKIEILSYCSAKVCLAGIALEMFVI